MLASLYWQSDETLEAGYAAPTGANAQLIMDPGSRPDEEVAGNDWASDLDQIIALADAARLAPPDPAVAASLSALVERLHGYVSAHVLAGLIEQLQETVTALVTIIDQISGLAEARAAIAPFDQAFAEAPREVSRDVHAQAVGKADEAKRSLAAALAQLEEAEQAQASSLPLKQKHARSAVLLDGAEGHARFGLDAAYTALMIVGRAETKTDAPLDPFQVLVVYDTPVPNPIPEAPRSESPNDLMGSAVLEADRDGWADDPASELMPYESKTPRDGETVRAAMTRKSELSQPDDELLQEDAQALASMTELAQALPAPEAESGRADTLGENSRLLNSQEEPSSPTEGLDDEKLKLEGELQVLATSGPEPSTLQDHFSLAEQRLADLRKQFRTKQQAKASFTLAKYARTCLF